MAKRRGNYGKAGATSSVVQNSKQLSHELLPSRYSMAKMTGGDTFQRSLGNYAKNTPADADGEGSQGLNIVSLGNMQT